MTAKAARTSRLPDNVDFSVGSTVLHIYLTAYYALVDRARVEAGETVLVTGASGSTALNVLTSALFSFNRRIVIERAAALGLPAIYEWPEMAEEGGLIGYGPRLTPIYRQLARLLVKVLRGAKPEDLPVVQPTNFELVINLTTAKALGLTIPEPLLVSADKVIE